MNLLIIGLGSMGKRRIRLLKNNFPQINVYGVDKKSERAEFCSREYGLKTFKDLEEALAEKIEWTGAFICSAPLTHAKLVHICLLNGLNIFSEIDLVDDYYEENECLAKEKNLLWFHSATVLYHQEISKINEIVCNVQEPLNYSYHVGQYLPDWHPWENYKDFFVGHERTNGCRELLAAEFPWILQTFGKVIDIKVFASKNTSLDINYNDNYMILLKHERGHKGVFLVDVVCREAICKLEIFGENLYLDWSGKPNSLRKKDLTTGEWCHFNVFKKIDHVKGYSNNVIENMYLEEIRAFLCALEKKQTKIYTHKENVYMLYLIDEIEKLGKES